jgi:putative tryptophan/tyrosine transport system substrate-binding protein
MKRRQFLNAFGCALVLNPALAQAQQQGKIPLVGILNTTDEDKFRAITIGAFEESFRDRGWINGKSVRIERRVVGTQTHLIPAMATELVALAPDVLVSIGTVNTAALAERTAKTPIVFVNVSDPVQSGFTVGLSKPSRNITGFVVFDPSMGGKMLQLLKDLTPEIRRVTAISNADTAPGNLVASVFTERTSQYGRQMGIEYRRTEVRTAADIEAAISSLGPKDGLLVQPDPFLWANRRLIFDLTARYRIPAIYSWAGYVVEGGLMAYTIDQAQLWRGAATYVDQLLKGARLEDLPIQLPTSFVFDINLATAKTLGLTFPRELVIQARRIVE